jgi:hypothetical protein
VTPLPSIPPVPVSPAVASSAGTLAAPGGLPGGNAWVAVLRQAGWPQDVVVLDFETYFDADYRMGKGHLSTIEYIQDARFEPVGLGRLIVRGEYAFTERKASFWTDVAGELRSLQDLYGERLERCTVVAGPPD